ncbi:MAG: hypothetical protein M5R36_13700 [Deltaproteobacteria bacterium]|nr:hypothetical protein [Deltaproteobacteria bacterium]
MEMARITSTDDVPKFVLTISGPGQQYDCSDPYPYEWYTTDAWMPECFLPNGGFGDQISFGESMTHSDEDSDNEYLDGFYADSTPPDEEHSYFFGYVLATLRGINFFKQVLDVDHNSGGAQVTNGKLVVGGISVGGIVALLANSVDDRLDGAFTWEATGAQEYSFKTLGVWMANRLASNSTYDPYAFIDCDDTSPDALTKKACEMLDYYDPVNFVRKNPVLIVTGAQDETFTPVAYQAAYNDYVADDCGGTCPKVSRALIGDVDHLYFLMLTDKMELRSMEAYGNKDPSYDDNPAADYYAVSTQAFSIRHFVH